MVDFIIILLWSSLSSPTPRSPSSSSIDVVLTRRHLDAFRRFCHGPGQHCSKVKRAAEAIADALAEPEPEADPKAEPFRRFCHMPGQRCSKAKRAADDLHQAAEEALSNV